MCQLIFSKTDNKDINKKILVSLLLIDTLIMHQDGFGVYHNGVTIKDTVTPHLVSDLGLWISQKVNTDKPVLAHVRQASLNTKVDILNNHPFETEHLILAHNGTLTIKKDKKVIDHDNIFKDVIDSEVFLKYLESIYVKNKKAFVKSLQETMELFTGKFAFLIYEKEFDKYYCARGTTADLHTSNITDVEGKVLGYVVNTDLKSLSNGLDIATANLQLDDIQVIYTAPVKLDDNSIFSLEKEIVKIGDIKENHEVYISDITNRHWNSALQRYVDNDGAVDGYINNYGYGYRGSVYQDPEVNKLVSEAMKFLTTYNMTLRDLDLICYGTLGVPIACLKDIKELEFFVDKILGKLTSNVRKDVKKAVEKRQKETGLTLGRKFYEDNKLQYPYQLVTNWKQLVTLLNHREKATADDL